MYLRTLLRVFTHAQLLPALESGEETLVGGQAVMEGVMMRAPHSYCVAVRRANGEIVFEQNQLERMSERYKIYKYPIFRGIGTLYQAMKLGIQALRFSANVAIADQMAAEGKADGKKAQPQKESGESSRFAVAASLLFPLAFFIFLYKFVPLWVVTKLEAVYPVLAGRLAFTSPWEPNNLIRVHRTTALVSILRVALTRSRGRGVHS